MGLGAPRHVGSSRTRDQTRVPYTGRWTASHWTTREVQNQPQSWFGARRAIPSSLLETSLPSAGVLIILGPWLQGLNV